MALFMGIDIGTSSVKTLLTDETGRTVAVSHREYDISKPNALFAEQDMKLIWEKTRETICEITAGLGQRTEEIQGISFSGQMHGLVMVDRNGELIRNAIIWCDQRASRQTLDVYEVVGEKRYKEITLNDLSSGFLLTSLLWVKENEKWNYEKIYKVMLPKDYIRYQMCGEIATDYSDASATLMFDTRRGEWAWELADQFGMDHSLFPDCYESDGTAGAVNVKCAEETGLREGTPVIYGGGDSIMQQIGNGVISEESPWIANIGTSCSVNCATQRPVFDRLFRVNTFCHAKKNMWFWMGANLCGGAALKWLKNNILHMNSYDEMSALADTAEPGSNGLVFLPYLSGSRSPVNDPDAQGIFFGLTLSHGRAHMTRSVMEGIILGMKTTFMIFEESGITTETMIASGGGARSDVFLQMEADIFDKPVYIADNHEQSCLGAAITAAVGTGQYKNYREACREMVRLKDKIVYPRTENQERYQESYAVYKDLYQTNYELFQRNRKRIH
ncbi:MAG: xylulokinase [Lachnospiraceae bacterium]|nr:xylulokinase [Lachnospiraceae bacterium]